MREGSGEVELVFAQVVEYPAAVVAFAVDQGREGFPDVRPMRLPSVKSMGVPATGAILPVVMSSSVAGSQREAFS